MRILLVLAFGCGASSATKPRPIVESPPRPAVEPQPATPVAPLSREEQVVAAQSKCDAGDQASCATYGGALMLGDGITKDVVRGAELLRGSCEAANGTGCELYARAFEHGWGVPQDANEFHRYMLRACDLDAGGGCRSYGMKFDTDDPQRIPYFYKACALRDGIGCMGLGAAYLNGGQGAPKDLVKAKHFLQLACDLVASEVACKKAAEL